MALNFDLEKPVFSDPATTCLFKWRMGEGPCQVPNDFTNQRCGFTAIHGVRRSEQEGTCANLFDPNAKCTALLRRLVESLERAEDETMELLLRNPGYVCELD